MFEESLLFQGSFKSVPRYLQGCFKGDSRVSKRRKGVSRDFQGSFKDILRVSKESIKCVSRKFQKKFPGCF